MAEAADPALDQTTGAQQVELERTSSRKAHRGTALTLRAAAGGISSQSTPMLTLPMDVLRLIVELLRHPSAGRPEDHRPFEDLQNLALTHRVFLDPVRAILFDEPKLLEDEMGKLPLRTFRPFVIALRSSEAVGSYVHHLPTFGEQIKKVQDEQTSPSLVSALALDVLERTPNLRTLSVPRVELKDQSRLLSAVCNLKSLKQLKFGVGCARNKDGTPLFHEGDLRSIARACPDVEELHIETVNIHFAPTSGWVEPFAFKSLVTVTLNGATSFGDNHLLALVSQSTHLVHLNIVDCVRSTEIDQRDRQYLTRSGIAIALERVAPRLKSFVLDDSRLRKTPKDDHGDVPSIERALRRCYGLETLCLAGPGIIRPDFLTSLGRIPAALVHLGISLPPLRPSPPALLHLTTLCLHIQPTPFPHLLKLLTALQFPPIGDALILPDLRTLLIVDEDTVNPTQRVAEQDQREARAAFAVALEAMEDTSRVRIGVKGTLWGIQGPKKGGKTERLPLLSLTAERKGKKGFVSGPWMPEVNELLRLPPGSKPRLGAKA